MWIYLHSELTEQYNVVDQPLKYGSATRFSSILPKTHKELQYQTFPMCISVCIKGVVLLYLEDKAGSDA